MTIWQIALTALSTTFMEFLTHISIAALVTATTMLIVARNLHNQRTAQKRQRERKETDRTYETPKRN